MSCHFFARDHGDHTREGVGPGSVNGHDPGMGMGAADKNQVGHVHELEVIGILPFSQNQALFSFFHNRISFSAVRTLKGYLLNCS
jgi:hypothetical protein